MDENGGEVSVFLLGFGESDGSCGVQYVERFIVFGILDDDVGHFRVFF